MEPKGVLIEDTGIPYITEEEPFWTTLEDISEKVDPLPPNVIMRGKGVFHHAGKVTANGNLYQPKYYIGNKQRLQESMDERGVAMLSGHPRIRDDGTLESPDPERVVGPLLNFDVLPNGEVIAEADVVGTTAGKNIAAMIKSGMKIGVSSRARGTAKKLLLTKNHPFAKGNEQWIGKEINVINEDFCLKSFDYVLEAASGGAGISNFREEKEEEMKLEELLKLFKEDDELRKKLLDHVFDSEDGKNKIKEAVEARAEELSKEFGETITKRVAEQVDEFVNSDEFKEMFDEEDGEPSEDDKLEAKCAKCGAVLAKGAKFCQACGVAIKEEKKEMTAEEKDKHIEALKKQIEDQKKQGEENTKKIEALEKKDKDTDERSNIEAKKVEALRDQPVAVSEKVTESLDKQVLTEENCEEKIKDTIAHVRSIFEAGGIDPSKLPSGKGKNIDDEPEEDKEALTEAQKGQQRRMRGL